MELIKGFLDIFLHLDKHMSDIILTYGTTTYMILFAIIFIETGLIIMPFLPGDSLLFVAGYFASRGDLNITYLCVLLFIAAFLGDLVNYTIGKFTGDKIMNMNLPFVKKEYFDKTHEFYEKHGPKTIIFARFIPIIRTFAPFIAGVGKMNYKTFITYNVVGGAIWVVLLLFAGYYFGGVEIVKKNFELVIFGIIFISILPPIIELLKAKFKK
ncbi:MAG: DedA family protein [Cytophagales bacterium]|nr:MAG: DedA family protein [Cytophagales bacterium]